MLPFSPLPNLPLFFLGILFSSFVFSAFGLFLSAPFEDIPQAMPPATVVRISLVFLCGVFSPVQALPLSLQAVAYLLPLTYSVDALRQTMSWPVNIQVFLIDLGVQVLYSIIFLVAATKVLKRTIT
jgi:ABC-2 type transport system permease protein